MIVDRQSAKPNRFKVTTDDGSSYYVTLERADEPTVEGTPLNAATLNPLFEAVEVAEEALTAAKATVPMTRGGTGATDGATGLKNLLAAGNTVLSSKQYGTTLPSAGTAGRIFFKVVG